MKRVAPRLTWAAAVLASLAWAAGARGAGGHGVTPPEPPPAGDFTHTPATEQKANTPLPVYAEISAIAVARARVKYRGAGMTDWARVDMKRMGKRLGRAHPVRRGHPRRDAVLDPGV